MQDVQQTDTVSSPAIKHPRQRPTSRLSDQPNTLEGPKGPENKRTFPKIGTETLSSLVSHGFNTFPGRLGTATADAIAQCTALTNKGSRQIASAWARTYIKSAPRGLKRAWQHFLLFCHFQLFDKSLNRLLFVPPPEQSDLATLLSGALEPHAPADRPIPKRLIDWALKAIVAETKSCTFVDCKAGRGRALILTARYPFDAILGVEPCAMLHDDALMNISQFPRSLMKCRSVECLQSDPAELPIPEENAIYFFFAPLDRKTMDQLLGRIVASYRKQPRRLYIVAVDPQHHDIIENSEVFEPVPYPVSTRLKIALFSPFRITAYRTLV